MIEEELEKEAREQAKKLEENQTLGVYDRDEDLEYDKGWNAGEVSGYEDGYIAGAKAILEKWRNCYLSCSSPYCAFPDVEVKGKLGQLEKKVAEND